MSHFSRQTSGIAPGAQGAEFAAGFIDRAGVEELWCLAKSGKEPDSSCAGTASRLLHVPNQEEFACEEVGPAMSVVGTWTLRGILNCMATVARRPAVVPAKPGERLCFTGLEATFPCVLPHLISMPGTENLAFELAREEQPCLGEDDPYFNKIAAAWSLRAVSPACDQRDCTNAISAASYATAARNARARSAFSDLSAFEIETRSRHIGMVAADLFMRTISWSSILIGTQPMRAFTGLIAWWAAATLLPRPFRLGMLSRCIGDPSLAAILLAADASYSFLKKAAIERAANTSALPTSGVKYSPAASGVIPTGARVDDIVGLLHGIPVFLPPRGRETGQWEMLIPLRLDQPARPGLFPGLPELARDAGSPIVKTALVHIGKSIENDTATPAITVVFFNSQISADSMRPDAGRDTDRALRWLGALCIAHRI